MVIINGISLKNITDFFGHEGEPLCQGDLYLNDKRIGQWSQDSWGGPDHFILDKAYDERLLNNAVKLLNPEKAVHGGPPDKPYVVEYDLDILMHDYINLTYDEESYQDAVKEGYDGVLIASDGYHQVAWNLPKSYTALSDDALLKSMQSGIEKAKESFFKETEQTKHTLKIYRSPDDFVIGKPVQLEQIMRKQDLDKLIAAVESKSEKAQKSSEPDLKKEKER